MWRPLSLVDDSPDGNANHNRQGAGRTREHLGLSCTQPLYTQPTRHCARAASASCRVVSVSKLELSPSEHLGRITDQRRRLAVHRLPGKEGERGGGLCVAVRSCGGAEAGRTPAAPRWRGASTRRSLSASRSVRESCLLGQAGRRVRERAGRPTAAPPEAARAQQLQPEGRGAGREERTQSRLQRGASTHSF